MCIHLSSLCSSGQKTCSTLVKHPSSDMSEWKRTCNSKCCQLKKCPSQITPDYFSFKNLLSNMHHWNNQSWSSCQRTDGQICDLDAFHYGITAPFSVVRADFDQLIRFAVLLGVGAQRADTNIWISPCLSHNTDGGSPFRGPQLQAHCMLRVCWDNFGRNSSKLRFLAQSCWWTRRAAQASKWDEQITVDGYRRGFVVHGDSASPHCYEWHFKLPFSISFH